MLITIKRLIMEATETPEDIRKKLYPSISKDIFKQIVSADPTTTSDKMGKYSNWLLGLYKEGNLKLEDLYKATEYLTDYNEDPKKYPRLSNIKDLPTLYKVISQRSGIERQTQDYSDVEKDKGAEFFYRDSDWILLSPKTQEASCKYGAGTQWCTAATRSGNRFDEYNDDGELYILIDRKNNRKWQFHFQTSQFNDETDNALMPNEIKNIHQKLPNNLKVVLDGIASMVSLPVESDLEPYQLHYFGVDYDILDEIYEILFKNALPKHILQKVFIDVDELVNMFDIKNVPVITGVGRFLDWLDNNQNTIYKKIESLVSKAYFSQKYILDFKEYISHAGLYWEGTYWNGALYKKSNNFLDFWTPVPEDFFDELDSSDPKWYKDVKENIKKLLGK